MRYDIVTIGGAVEDITFYTKEGQVIDNQQDILRQTLLAFEYGTKIKIDAAHTTFGGGATNVAIAASRLGLKSACICAVGNDERGKKIVKNLKEQKVDTRFVQKVRGEMSGFSFLLVGTDNEHVIFSYRAANSELKISQKKLKKINSEYLYVTSLSGQWRETVKNIFSCSEKFKIAWNPGHIQLSEGQNSIKRNLPKVDVFIINEDEALELVVTDKNVMRNRKENAGFLSNVKNLLRIIEKYGPRIVVITRGRKGADVYDGKKFYHMRIQKEHKRIDTTGVGDAFGSSFVCGLKLYNGDIEKAIELGIKNTASVIGQQGAQNGLIKL